MESNPSSNSPHQPTAIPPEPSPELKSEAVRLSTFSNWPVSFVSPIELSKAGFYYLGRGDSCRCAFCGSFVGDWEEEDEPMAEHLRLFPMCPFVRGLEVGNQNMRREGLRIQSQSSNNDSGHDDAECRWPPGHKSSNARPAEGNGLSNILMSKTWPVSEKEENNGIIEESCLLPPNYATFEARLKTFHDWPSTSNQQPQELAQAGFYYLGLGDQVECFYCDGGIRNWQREDIPWVEHSIRFSDCGFLRLEKGDDFVNKCLIEKPLNNKELTSDMEPGVSNKIKKLALSVEELLKSSYGTVSDPMLHTNGMECQNSFRDWVNEVFCQIQYNMGCGGVAVEILDPNPGPKFIGQKKFEPHSNRAKDAVALLPPADLNSDPETSLSSSAVHNLETVDDVDNECQVPLFKQEVKDLLHGAVHNLETVDDVDNECQVPLSKQEVKDLLHGGCNDTNKNLQKNIFEIGKIAFDTNQPIGSGASAGVYKGTYEGRAVAVKRILRNKLKDINREESILSSLGKGSSHQNVVKLLGTENDDSFCYLALPLCKTDFNRALQDPSEIKLDVLTMLEQALKGIEFIHAKTPTKPRIAHRDIKPDNILIYEDQYTGQQRVMVADYGLSKQAKPEKSKVISVQTKSLCGTKGWKSFELMKLENPSAPYREITVSVDIFSFGCVTYFMLTFGKHPFQHDEEDDIYREVNISNGKYYLDGLNVDKFPYSRSLIEKMISHDPEMRPTATEVLNDPMFKLTNRGPLILSALKAIIRNVSGKCFSNDGHSCRFVQSFHSNMGATFFKSVEQVFGRDWYKKIKNRLDDKTIQPQDVIAVLSGTHGEVLSGNKVPTTALTDITWAEYTFVDEDKAWAGELRKSYPMQTIDIIDVAAFHKKPMDLKKRIEGILPKPKYIIFAFCNSKYCEDINQVFS